MITSNPDAPHSVVLWMHAEVHEVLKTGECSGMPVHKIPRFVIRINGQNKDEAIQKLNAIVKELNNK